MLKEERTNKLQQIGKGVEGDERADEVWLRFKESGVSSFC